MQSRERDAELVGRCLAGEREAFDLLVRMNFTRVYALLFRLAGNHEDAEDMTQESFTKAYGSLAHYRGESSFYTWVARIGIHLAHDRRRRSERGPRRLDFEALTDLPSSTDDEFPDRNASRKELALHIAGALRRLPDALHTVTVLRLFEGCDYEELADLTGVQPGTVRTQLMRSRKLLLEWLAPWLERSPRP